ncbi:hypothetical protein Bpfe_009735 [Biomphalaria pfeifferi]|uniref:Uncharacterized protein n=1 Tax=Biomphalaria pfeifferi TaxID=112525 RepID=A0AAD8BU29_BIOPF|nr:hypothetical protein Bpfe_009735 [Biomphalaria pfeifferi]
MNESLRTQAEPPIYNMVAGCRNYAYLSAHSPRNGATPALQYCIGLSEMVNRRKTYPTLPTYVPGVIEMEFVLIARLTVVQLNCIINKSLQL